MQYVPLSLEHSCKKIGSFQILMADIKTFEDNEEVETFPKCF